VSRLLAALSLEEPDLVPISDVGVDAGVLGEALGLQPHSEAEYARGLAKIGFDMVVSRHRLLGHGQKILGPEPEEWKPHWIDDETYQGEWGEIRRITADMESPVEGTISSLDDLSDFEVPDPCRPGRIDPVKDAVDALGESTPVFALLHDAFELPWMMRGSIPRLVTDYHRNPRLARKLAEVSTKFNTEMAKMLLDEGVAGIVTGDDYAFASGPFMSPEHFGIFIYPYLRKLIRAAHARGAPFIKHTDGMIWPILEQMLRAGPDAINPIQTEAGMVLRDVKRIVGNRVAIMGNVDCGRTLHYGTVRDVQAEVSRCMGEGAPGGGFILSSSNTIYKGTKPENLLAMTKFARRIGKYRPRHYHI
jgi:uroporphyrinogen decarboxylase